MQKVIFDSSFLMAITDEPTTWFEDIVERVGRFEPIMLDCVHRELNRLAAGQGRKARTARLSIGMASKFSPVPCGGSDVDEEVASLAVSCKGLVATVDEELARFLRAAHVRVIHLSQGRVVVS